MFANWKPLALAAIGLATVLWSAQRQRPGLPKLRPPLPANFSSSPRTPISSDLEMEG